jgi:hypothetical protein
MKKQKKTAERNKLGGALIKRKEECSKKEQKNE